MSARRQQPLVRSRGEPGQILSKAHLYKRYTQADQNCVGVYFSCSFTQILKRDENSQVQPPKIIQEEMQKSSPKGSRPFSTAARNRLESLTRSGVAEEKILKQMRTNTELTGPGHIFGLPELPLPENDRLKQRYHPLILQVTNLLMRDGKKGVAQRVWPSVFSIIIIKYSSGYELQA